MKHVHHDLIVEWAKDTSKEWQAKSKGHGDDAYEDCFGDPVWSYAIDYRIKPREFVKGHWYPCIFKGGSVDSARPMYFNGKNFSSFNGSNGTWNDDYFQKIGQSLGELNFGE